jgi:hypothetical protein
MKFLLCLCLLGQTIFAELDQKKVEPYAGKSWFIQSREKYINRKYDINHDLLGSNCSNEIFGCVECDQEFKKCNQCQFNYILKDGTCELSSGLSIPYCNTYDIKGCSSCLDESSLGGFQYNLYEGKCVLTATFDDLPEQLGDGYLNIPYNYIGLEFQFYSLVAINADKYSPNTFGKTGFRNGRVSGDYAAINFNKPDSSVFFKSTSNKNTFTLVDLYLTSGVRNGLTVTIYCSGPSITDSYMKTVSINSENPTKLTFNWSNINYCEYYGHNDGINPGYHYDEQWIVIDNLTIIPNL